ncbi:MAG: hypothetical protein ACFFED_08935 [Candidatus Thorarchaeota archaeon]
MEIEYKKWESGKGLEEIQAKIYTEVSGLSARPEQIGPRNDERGADMTHYALTKDGKPLAYITSWKSSSEDGRYGIGYPWALPSCPNEVKMKLFEEQLKYLKSKDDFKILRTAVVTGSKTADAQLEFFEKNGFVETSRALRYNKDYDTSLSSKMTVEGKAAKLESRLATEDDVETLIELLHSDPNIRGALPTEDAARSYFKERVLKDGHAVILFDGDKAVAASALLRFEPDGSVVTADSTRIIHRFVAIRPGYKFAWERLLVELSKEAVSAGWEKIPLRSSFGVEVQDASAITIAKTEPMIDIFEIILTYEEN